METGICRSSSATFIPACAVATAKAAPTIPPPTIAISNTLTCLIHDDHQTLNLSRYFTQLPPVKAAINHKMIIFFTA
jgi:hypothetical protein